MAALNVGSNLIVGGGTPEAVWLAWPGLADVPRLSLDGWLPASQRLVVIAPHPDDEILAGGGLASQHAQRGGRVLIVAVTDGEASHRGSPEWSFEALAAERRTESARGLAMLIAAPPQIIRLGLPDAGVAQHRSRLQSELQALMRPADTVITTWRRDGHPDHDATGAAAAGACAAVQARLLEAPVWMWHWSAPADARIPWHRLRGVDLSPDAQRRRRRAITAHQTQLSPRSNGEGPVLTDALVARLDRRTEYFFVPAGRPDA